jgi:hypothetical protein
MIVNDFDILGTGVRPNEADAPLVVDPDTVLSDAIATQQFQPVSRRRSKITQRLGVMELPQFALSNPLQIGPQPPGEASVEQRLGILIGKRADHPLAVYPRCVMNVKRS